MTTLYYSRGACSLAAHILLEESGLTFDTRCLSLNDGDQLSKDFQRINPHGRVPALETERAVITESLAILTWIARSAQGRNLLPDDPIEAARAYEKLSFFISSVHIAFAQIWRPERFITDERHHDALRQGGRHNLSTYFDEIEFMMRGVTWLIDQTFSAADLYPFVFYRWARRVDIDPTQYPAWTRHTSRMLDRPSVQRALMSEDLSRADFIPLDYSATNSRVV